MIVTECQRPAELGMEDPSLAGLGMGNSLPVPHPVPH